jgi:predicted RNase H-like nuclease (RuvC/YqgF family)
MRKKKTLEQFFSRARDIAKELDMNERSLAEEITEGFDALKQIRELEAEIEALKQESAEKFKRLEHLEKIIVYYHDITMTGAHSEEYENGFWDAVDYVKWHQLEAAGGYGHN